METLKEEPEEVKVAVKKEQMEADPVGQWIRECLVGDENSEISTSACQAHYNEWAKDAGQPQMMNPKTFKRRMEKPEREIDGLKIERVTQMFGKNTGGYKNVRIKLHLDLDEENAKTEVEKSYEQGKLYDDDDLDENTL
jgi:phage/plasmid-associated DNA primase